MTNLDPFDNVVRPFAGSMFLKANLLRGGTLTDRQRPRVHDAITKDLQILGDVLCPDVRPFEISRAAWERAQSLGVDLRTQTWHRQWGFDPKRATFLIEHVTPNRVMREAAVEADSVDAIVEIIRRHYRVAWILKSENDELNRLGFRTKRPDPDDAYRQAGIVLMAAADFP